MIWRVELYKRGDIFSTETAVIQAETQEQAAELASQALADSDYADVEPMHVSDARELPVGSFFRAFKRA